MKIVVGIPARMGSTRFPGKPLCDILGKTMIEHCYRRCALSKYATSLFVAACDPEIQQAVEGFGHQPDLRYPPCTACGPALS